MILLPENVNCFWSAQVMQMQDARVSDLQLDIPKSYQGAGTFMQIYPCKYKARPLLGQHICFLHGLPRTARQRHLRLQHNPFVRTINLHRLHPFLFTQLALFSVSAHSVQYCISLTIKSSPHPPGIQAFSHKEMLVMGAWTT